MSLTNKERIEYILIGIGVAILTLGIVGYFVLF